MTQLDLIPDLTWMAQAHDPATHFGGYSVPRPFTLPAGILKPLTGPEEYIIDGDFTIAVGASADVAVRGHLADARLIIPLALPQHIYVWCAQTFFVADLQCAEIMSLAALAQRADLPPPTLTRCPRCRGKGREPDADALIGDHATMAPHCLSCGAPQAMGEDNQALAPACAVCGGPLSPSRGCVSAPVCTKCDGNGRIADSSGLGTLHGVTVDWRALQYIVPHLRGDRVALCVAPAVDHLGLDCHLRPYVKLQGKSPVVGGDWRVAWHAVPAAVAA